jgi:1-acyl-sn-glycerol-3-phosphate acyltransferase
VIARLHAYFVLGYTGLSMAFFFLAIAAPAILLTGNADLSIWLARHLWSPSILWLARIKLQIEGPPLPDGPAIFASNHESAFDINVLFVAIPRNLRFVAKRELFEIPVFGWYLRMAGYVEVDRGNRRRAFESLKKGGEQVRAGASLIAFPEGTRSIDGRVHPFKKGPFVLAMEAQVPVVPVAIVGASAVTPKGQIKIRPGTVRVLRGEPVMPQDHKDKESLLREVRRRIIELHRRGGGLGGEMGKDVAAAGVEGRTADEEPEPGQPAERSMGR